MKNIRLILLVTLLALLAVGQKAQATITESMTFGGYHGTNGSQSQYAWRISGFMGTQSGGPSAGTSQSFSNQTINFGSGNSLTINGTLNFNGTGSIENNVTAGTQVTLVFESTNWLFYGATVKNLAGSTVSGSGSPGSDNKSITVTIPSGTSFYNINLELAIPISSANISGISASTYIDDCVNKPVPVLTYNQTTLTAGTDYTVSYSDNDRDGTATLTVTGMGAFAGSNSVNYTIRAVTLSDFVNLGTNIYGITNKQDLAHLAAYVNHGGNNCSGLTFRQTADIVCDDTYTPIGGYDHVNSTWIERPFSGTYDGQGRTISGITVNRTGNDSYSDCYIGVIGNAKNADIKNIVLANSSFMGYRYVGGISGHNGNISNCRVESSVSIKAGSDGASWFGGISGRNDASIIGCVSAASVNKNGKASTDHFGGIAGLVAGATISHNLYVGTDVQSKSYAGSIAGSDENAHFVNNYYTSTDRGGVSGYDQDGARRARVVTLGANVAIVGDETSYDVSGLTAIGTCALRSGNTIYSGYNQTLTLNYTGTIPDGKSVTFFINGNSIEGNSFTMPASDVTITATLEDLAHYTVRFDKNKDAATGTMDDMSFIYGTSQKLTSNAFSCTGYNFGGWNTMPDGSGDSYSNDATVNNLTETADDVVVLYAQWTPIKYTITYDLAGGSVSPSNPDSYTVESADITLVNPTRTGYTFRRWCWKENSTNKYAETVTISAGSTGNRSYTAEWTGTPWSGDGSKNNPFIISTTTDLDNLAIDVNHGISFKSKFFELGADISYSYIDAWNNKNSTENNFSPIGRGQFREKVNSPFSGVFDGKGHTVSGIRVNMTTGLDAYHIGLFGKIQDGAVRNVIISNSTFKGIAYIGGIAGYNAGGAIENCRVESNVSFLPANTDGADCGGVVGFNSTPGTVLACLCAGTVSCNGKREVRAIGGIAGANSGDVKDCLFIGPSIAMTNDAHIVGGIIGDFWTSTGSFSNNYYTASGMGGVGVATWNAIGEDQDGARIATAYPTIPADRIGTQTATYSNGITAYEHGLAYNGTYYLDSRLTGSDVNLTLVQGTKDGVTSYWATFYNSSTIFTLPAGATAYTMSSAKQLYRLGADGRTIPENTAVVIIADRASIMLTVGTNSTAITVNSGGNILQGSDSPVTVSGLSGTPHVLGVVGDVFGFHPYTGTEIPANKAYYIE